MHYGLNPIAVVSTLLQARAYGALEYGVLESRALESRALEDSAAGNSPTIVSCLQLLLMPAFQHFNHVIER